MGASPVTAPLLCDTNIPPPETRLEPKIVATERFILFCDSGSIGRIDPAAGVKYVVCGISDT